MMLGWSIPLVNKVSTPIISPAGGLVTTIDFINISCTTAQASIWYTLDGSTPTTLSTPYSGPFTLIDSSGESLIDPEKILAAYNFSGGSLLNTVSGALYGSLVLAGGATLSDGKLNIPFNVGAPDSYSQSGSTVTVSAYSFSAFITPANFPNCDIAISAIVPSFARMYGAPWNNYMIHCGDSPVVGYVGPVINDGVRRHYTWTYDIVAGVVKTYVNGTLTQTLRVPAIAEGNPARNLTLSNASSPGGASISIDNIVINKEVLTPAAVVALASGNMPSANGVLIANQTVKAFATKYSLTDSDMTSATFTVSEPSLILPNSIIGAYNFGVGGYFAANIVVGAPAGSHDTANVNGYALPVSSSPGLSGGFCQQINPANPNCGVSIPTGVSTTQTTLTISAAIRSTATNIRLATSTTGSIGNINVMLDLNASSGSMILVDVPGNIGATGLAQLTVDDSWHYYAIVIDGLSWKFYKDGAISSQGTFSAYSAFSISYLHLYTSPGIGPTVSWDNVFWSREPVSAEAIAAFHAGHMPNSLGVLT